MAARRCSVPIFSLPRRAGMKDVITNDKETMFSFDALNADGVHASVGIMGSNGMISITKNKNQE